MRLEGDTRDIHQVLHRPITMRIDLGSTIIQLFVDLATQVVVLRLDC
jgi:hypothetical protein